VPSYQKKGMYSKGPCDILSKLMCASNKKKAHLFALQYVKAKNKNIKKSWERKLLAAQD